MLCCLDHHTVFVNMMQLCGQSITLLQLVNLPHAVIGVSKLSLVSHDVTVLFSFYLIFVCQVLIMF